MQAQLLGKLSRTIMIPRWLACSRFKELDDSGVGCNLEPLLAEFYS